MTQISDGLRIGPAKAVGSAASRAAVSGSLESTGVVLATPSAVPTAYQYGAVTTATRGGIVVAQKATGGSKTLSATGILASAGVATFDVPRNVTWYSTGNNSAKTVTVSGTSMYGTAITEKITGPNNGTASGIKAFKTVTSVVTTSNIVVSSFGNGNRLGLPYRAINKGQIASFSIDGGAVTPTIVVAAATSVTSTATTADVRGTITATNVPNGTRRYTVVQIADASTQTYAYGITPA